VDELAKDHARQPADFTLPTLLQSRDLVAPSPRKRWSRSAPRYQKASRSFQSECDFETGRPVAHGFSHEYSRPRLGRETTLRGHNYVIDSPKGKLKTEAKPSNLNLFDLLTWNTHGRVYPKAEAVANRFPQSAPCRSCAGDWLVNDFATSACSQGNETDPPLSPRGDHFDVKPAPRQRNCGRRPIDGLTQTELYRAGHSMSLLYLRSCDAEKKDFFSRRLSGCC